MSWRVTATKTAMTTTGVERRRYRVLYVVDGDGFAIADGPHGLPVEIVRMLCMDAPERDQEGWRDAKDALASMIEGQVVELEPEHKWRFVRDRYGRCLTYVFLGDLLVNAEMVRLGWSDFLTKFGRGRYQHVFCRCMNDAEAHRRGIWALYEPGDFWTWGRGRQKPHFRTSGEMEEYKKRIQQRRHENDGEVSTDLGTLARVRGS